MSQNINYSTGPKWKSLFTIAGNAIMMNLAFIIACIPVVTIGQAWCGLFSAVRFTVRGDKWWPGFKTGFKTRFLRGTIGWLICIAAVAYLGVNTVFNIYYQWQGNEVSCVIQALCFLICMMLTVALIALNVYIPTGKMQWIRNAITLVVKFPVHTAIAAVLMFLPIVGVVLMLYDTFFFFVLALGFVGVYFSLAVLFSTVALKDPLIHIKLEMEAMEEEEESEEDEDEEDSEDDESDEEESEEDEEVE